MPLRHRQPAREFVGDERGGILVLFAVFIIPMLMLAGVVIDLGMARAMGNRLQIAADAAALAGAGSLELECTVAPYESCVRGVARTFSSSNLPDPEGGAAQILADQDIVLGVWDPASRTFTANPDAPNAVQVTTRHSGVQALFGGMFEFGAFTLAGHAIAISEPGAGCESGGFFSDDETIIQSDGTHISGFCLYGRRQVTTSQNNTFEEGTIVAARNGNVHDGGSNPGLQEAIRSAEFPLSMPARASDLISALEAGTGVLPGGITELPFNIDATSVIPTSDDVIFGEEENKVKIDGNTVSIEENSVYVVSDGKSVVFKPGTDYENIAVVASSIKIESDVTIFNVVLGAHEKLEVGSKATIGYEDFCSTNQFAAYLFSEGTMDIASNNNLYGVQMASMDYMKIQSGDPSNYKSVYAETMGLLEYQSANSMSACDNLIGSAFGKSSNPFGISVLALVD